MCLASSYCKPVYPNGFPRSRGKEGKGRENQIKRGEERTEEVKEKKKDDALKVVQKYV